MSAELRLDTVRPLIRYVDEEQAVIETHFHAVCPIERAQVGFTGETDVHITIQSLDGFHDEGQARTPIRDGEGSLRFEVVHPQRWWPAGMGEQPLYELTLRLLAGDSVVDQRSVTIGLTSVRKDAEVDDDVRPGFLVNGRHLRVSSVVMVDRIDENQLLPATGDSLLMIRDHYGPELLYEAADRAGVLLIQSVPISAEGRPSVEVAEEVDRLTAHPSLAGWYVGHLGPVRDLVTQRLTELDPTHTILDRFETPKAS